MDNSTSENSFVVEYHGGNQNWQVISTVGMDITTLTVIDLQPGSTHYFRVKATNSLYESDYSNILQLSMPVFPAPTDLVADSVSFSSLVLNWQDNSDYEDHFVVEISPDGLAWTEETTVDTDVI
ncbi:MAG: hypothetical protein C0600_08885, partial [Ignavibacteria bacterium]